MTDQPSWPDLQEQIRASAGQFILYVEIDETRQPGTGGCFGVEFFYSRQASMTLGIIAASQDLTRKLSGVSVAVDKKYHIASFASNTSDRPIYVYPELLGLPVEFNDHNLRRDYPDEKLAYLVVGDKPVSDWFSLVNGTRGAEWVAWRLHPERHRSWFEKAAAALGRRLEHSPHLDETEESERRDLLERLWRQSNKLEPHIRHIQALRRATETTGVISHGGALSVVEDEDDLRIQAMRSRQEIDRLLADLRRTLDRAKQLGLSDHPYVTAFELRWFGES